MQGRGPLSLLLLGRGSEWHSIRMILLQLIKHQQKECLLIAKIAEQGNTKDLEKKRGSNPEMSLKFRLLAF